MCILRLRFKMSSDNLSRSSRKKISIGLKNFGIERVIICFAKFSNPKNSAASSLFASFLLQHKTDCYRQQVYDIIFFSEKFRIFFQDFCTLHCLPYLPTTKKNFLLTDFVLKNCGSKNLIHSSNFCFNSFFLQLFWNRELLI